MLPSIAALFIVALCGTNVCLADSTPFSLFAYANSDSSLGGYPILYKNGMSRVPPLLLPLMSIDYAYVVAPDSLVDGSELTNITCALNSPVPG